MDKMLAPDVGALVEYGLDGFNQGPGRYRVDGWLRVAPVPPPADPTDFHAMLADILFYGCQELPVTSRSPETGKARMQFCLRSEATHLSLSGVGGAIAPIAECKVTGMVPWSAEHLAEARASANRHGATHEMIF